MRSKNIPDGQDHPSFIEAARRAQIIDAAIDTLADVGYARSSLAEIAKRAQISKSIISYYFAGKDDLLRQVVVKLYEEGVAFMAPKIAVEVSPATALRTYIVTNIEYIAAHVRHINAVAEVLANMRDASGNPPWDAASADWMVEGPEQLLRWGQETGDFRPFAPRTMAVSLRAAIDAFSVQLLAHPDLDVASYVSELVTLFDFATRNPERVQPPASRSLNLAPKTIEEKQP
jgi:AcrR family transcriptional regulator